MEDWSEIKPWRKARRDELIACRVALGHAERLAWNTRMTALLNAGFALPSGTVVGYCWPYKAEFDARFAVRNWCAQGAVAALPEVIAKAGPLQFRQWWPGAPMKPGVYGIPVPDGTPVLLPDVAVVPMNGFDACGYRLGYGGGYFDRTLAALEGRILTIGVSYEALRLPTIHPQPHDIAMDFVVTETGIHRAGGSPLALIDATACARAAESLLKDRNLPRLAGGIKAG